MSFSNVTLLWMALISQNLSSQEIDLSGDWELSYRMPDGKEVVRMSLARLDSSLLATSTIGEFKIKVDAENVSWSYPLSFRKGKELASFRGEIKSKDHLKGIFIVHHGIYQGRAVKWKALRLSDPDNNIVKITQ